MNCNNCNTEINSKYCPGCGQISKLPRIDGHYIIHEINHVLHFEKGILFTIRELLVRPGKNIRQFITQNRSRLVKPIIFIIVTSLIYSLISRYFHIEEEYMRYEGFEKSSISKILKWMQANYGYMNILMGIFIAFWLKVIFKKYGYNFFELLIMLCFTLGITMLIYAVCAVLEGVFHFKLFFIAGTIGVIYLIWAMGNFFEARKIMNYIKAFICFLLGTITFYIIILAIGITLDILTKH